MIFEMLHSTDSRWRDYVTAWESDVYQLPEYGVATRKNGEDVRAALVTLDDRALLMPLIVRAVEADAGILDAISPYGYPGLLLSPMIGDDRRHFLDQAIPALVNGFLEAGIVSVFVRMHPLVGLQPDDLSGVGTTVFHGDTVIVDLGQSEEELWSETRKGHRYEINRSRKRGHRAFHDVGWEHFDEFLDVYAETMRRVDASESYKFDRGYFLSLREALGKNLRLWVVDIDGEVAAASLFTEYNGIVQYHLSGTRTNFLKLQPNKLLLHEVRLWAKARGNRVMNLGGGVGGARDSLFAFKAGFSKQTRPFYTWRLITGPEAYGDIVRRRGLNPRELDPSGFFPAYRRNRA